MESIDHLFRRESGRMVAAVTRVFGVHNLAMAQDVVQDAFCRAVEVWAWRGVPENPSAWLMTAAKNRALDMLRRERTARTYAPELGRLLESEWTLVPVVEELFAPDAIKDDLLRMMFSCCHPRLSEEAQVSLVLHILCGFGTGEIAGAFVSGRASIEKRITRAKKVLAGSKTLFDLDAPKDFSKRLPAVQRALYLLFNEGYHGASPESAVRRELCREAMRLVALLLEHPQGKTSATFALASLCCLNGARLPARVDGSGDLRSLFDQDRSLWDSELRDEGLRFLELSATGSKLTTYHLEAAIAAVHARAQAAKDTDWGEIVSLYDALMSIHPSPIVGLNRAIAMGQHLGPERGLQEIQDIPDSDRLAFYPFYFAAIGEFELRLGRTATAREHFLEALSQARNPLERKFLARRVETCEDRLLARP